MPWRRSSSSSSWRTPAPSCMRTSGISGSSSTAIVRPADGCPGGQTRITSSEKNGSNSTARRRRAAPTIPSSSSRSATRRHDGLRVVNRQANVERRVRLVELAQEQRHDDRRRARRRPDLERARERPEQRARRAPRASAPRARAAAGRFDRDALPASVGTTRRPERSSSWMPTRFSSARTCWLTAGCVTPSVAAAREKLSRSTTAQNARELPRIHKLAYTTRATSARHWDMSGL